MCLPRSERSFRRVLLAIAFQRESWPIFFKFLIFADGVIMLLNLGYNINFRGGILMDKIDKKVLQAVQEASAANADGRLSCGQAWAVAEQLQVPRKVIGEAANQLKIKIKACQLGCF